MRFKVTIAYCILCVHVFMRVCVSVCAISCWAYKYMPVAIRKWAYIYALRSTRIGVNPLHPRFIDYRTCNLLYVAPRHRCRKLDKIGRGRGGACDQAMSKMITHLRLSSLYPPLLEIAILHDVLSFLIWALVINPPPGDFSRFFVCSWYVIGVCDVIATCNYLTP